MARFRPVPLPALQTAKVDLMERLFSLQHRSRLDQIEAALAALGKCLYVEARDAA